MGAEVGGQKDIFKAKATTSSATGPGQYTKDTWLKAVAEYRPDIFRNYDEKTILGMRSTNPQLVESILTQDVAKYTETLMNSGIAPTQGNVYMVHFLGAPDAIKVLTANPDATVSDAGVNPDSIQANKSILENKTAAEVTSWADKKMASSTPIDLGGPVVSITPVGEFDPTASSAYSPTDSIAKEVNKIFGRQSTNTSGIGTLNRYAQANAAQANDASQDTVQQTPETSGEDVYGPEGGSRVRTKLGSFGETTPEDVKTSGVVDWSKGNLPFIDNTAYKEQLYNQQNPFFPGEDVANSVTGDTPESYAQKFTGGDVSKVQSRISYMNGVPQVEFFAKGMDQVLGDVLGGVAKAIVPGGMLLNMFGGDTSQQQQPAPPQQGSSDRGGADRQAQLQQAVQIAQAAPTTLPTVTETPTVTTTPFVEQPVTYTGRVSTVKSPYQLAYGGYGMAQNNLSTIQDALSLLNKRTYG